MAYDLQADLAEAKRLTTLQNGDQYATPTPAPTRYTGATPAITNPVQNIAPLSTPTAPNTPTSPTMGIVDENAIRESTRQRMQSSIDAINANYANLISQERVQGQDRSGQTRAINARSGTLGSDFGSAQQQKTTQFNASQEKALVDEQNAKISAVMMNIEDRASQEIQMRKQEALGKYQMEMGEYEKAQAMAREDFKTLAASGVDLKTLAPAQKAALFKQAGYEGDMGELVYNAMKPKPKQIDYKYEKLADGKGMFWGVDPQTGELKRLEIDIALPPEWDMTVTPDGSIIGFDKNSGETRMLSSQGQFAKTDPLDDAYKQAQIDKIRNEINQEGDGLLSIDDAKKLGVPYGTTRSQALAGQTQADPQRQAQAKSTIDQISNVLKSSGLNSVVGPNGIARWSIANALTGKSSNAIADVQQIVEQLTLDKLIQAKANGATFGALSDGERQMLASSASKIGSWAIKDANGKVTGYKANEKDFRAELNRIGNFAKADYILKGGNVNDVEAQTMQDGTVWTKNADGSMVKILDKLPTSFNSAGNALDSKVKGTKQSVAPLSYIDPKTFKAVAPVIQKSYPEGSVGGQCGTWVRKVVSKMGATYPTLGDSLKSKTAAVKKYGTSLANATIGSVIVTKENPTYGHVAYIIGKNAKGWIVAESNYKQSEKVSYGRTIPFSSSKVIGVINPTKS